ncbi:MAG TPA: nucleoside monophosphate kinase [Polyangia bacterium]|jgi:adenylate kinase|nr:nucleoside monophosphate kinase [Polyangia bacterium]
MSDPESPPSGPADVGASRIASPELEIKDAPLIFGQVWNRLVEERGLENMVFPKEIMWLGGAPGSGKGTNTPFILRERGLTAAPIVVSDLLDTSEMRALKDLGQFVGDREVIAALLRKLLEPAYQTGVVVDGFPRTKVQAEAVKLLHDQIMQLRTMYWGTPTGKRFRRPIFRITVLFVGEQTSVERQLNRGREIRAHNDRALRTGAGALIELRPTDIDEALARNRYRTFKELTYEALTSLRRHFHYHFVNADAPLGDVERSINAEFQYQSSLELGQATLDIIHHIPLVSELTLHARQELVRRLDSYEHAAAPLFKEVAVFIETHIVPVIVRHALAGRCVVKTDSALFERATSVDMVLDTLAERGYQAVYQEHRTPVPETADPRTGIITCQDRTQHTFEIRFHPPEIRRGH